MRRPQFRLRILLLIIMASAIALGAVIGLARDARRQRLRLALAAYHSRRATELVLQAEDLAGVATMFKTDAHDREESMARSAKLRAMRGSARARRRRTMGSMMWPDPAIREFEIRLEPLDDEHEAAYAESSRAEASFRLRESRELRGWSDWHAARAIELRQTRAFDPGRDRQREAFEAEQIGKFEAERRDMQSEMADREATYHELKASAYAGQIASWPDKSDRKKHFAGQFAYHAEQAKKARATSQRDVAEPWGRHNGDLPDSDN